MVGMPDAFQSARTPQVVFRAGGLAELPTLVKSRGIRSIGVVSGATWFPQSDHWRTLRDGLTDRGIAVHHETSRGEPSPEGVDRIAEGFRSAAVEAVLAVGGGSVLDAGKASAAAVRAEGSIGDYLEGVGSKTPDGRSLPVIAVPSSAGTGAEATKNAVLSSVGPDGFKKSLRHDNFIPVTAVIDPELTVSASPEVSAASGMDAITQLLEAYISTRASVFTDALAELGLRLAGRSFLEVIADGTNLTARGDMSYAAYLSGVCLANAGLGIVHGAASPAGALTKVPHGVFCGNMLLPSMEATVQRLGKMGDTTGRAAAKLAVAGRLLEGNQTDELREEPAEGMARLLDRLRKFAAAAPYASLSAYDIGEDTISRIAEQTGLKNHPVAFSRQEVQSMLAECL